MIHGKQTKNYDSLHYLMQGNFESKTMIKVIYVVIGQKSVQFRNLSCHKYPVWSDIEICFISGRSQIPGLSGKVLGKLGLELCNFHDSDLTYQNESLIFVSNVPITVIY